MTPQEEIEQLESNLRLLLDRYADLEKQVSILQSANKAQREALLQTSAELVDMRRKYEVLRTAHAMTAATEDKERAKRHISALVTKIDNAIRLISSDSPEVASKESGE